MDTMNKNEQLSRDVVSVRSKDHMITWIKNPKNAVNSFYDMMQLESAIACLPFGHKQ